MRGNEHAETIQALQTPYRILGSMVPANVDLVRSILAHWEGGDFSSAEWAHGDVECVFAGGSDPGSWTGLAGMAEGMRSSISAWSEFRVETDEYRELDSERVLVLSHVIARGNASGLSRPFGCLTSQPRPGRE